VVLAKEILTLFDNDEMVLSPSEIIGRTTANVETIRTTLKRMTKRGELYRIKHGQYARSANAIPRLGALDRLADLERRIFEIELKLRIK